MIYKKELFQDTSRHKKCRNSGIKICSFYEIVYHKALLAQYTEETQSQQHEQKQLRHHARLMYKQTTDTEHDISIVWM